MGLFAASVLFLLGATLAVFLAQTEADPLAPWISIGYSAGAVICACAAILMGRRR